MMVDCVLVLLCDNDVIVVVVVYVGWKGLVNGIIVRIIVVMVIDVECFYVWIGFVISGFCYEVDIGMVVKFMEFFDVVLVYIYVEKCYLDLFLIVK